MHVKHPDEVEFSADVSTVGQLGLEQFEPFFKLPSVLCEVKLKKQKLRQKQGLFAFFLFLNIY